MVLNDWEKELLNTLSTLPKRTIYRWYFDKTKNEDIMGIYIKMIFDIKPTI